MKNNLLTVILAAGQSRRFSEAGFPKPKTLLSMPHDRTLLEAVIKTLASDNLLFVGAKDHFPIMRSTMKRIHFSSNCPEKFRDIWVEKTKGPLDTVWEIRGWIEHSKEIVFSYCDIFPDLGITEDFIRSMRDLEMDAGIIGFDSDQDRFTTIGGSTMKASGIFYFKSGRDLIHRMRFKKRGENNGLPEMVYDYDRWGVFDVSGVLADLGTPEDYKYYVGKHGMTKEDTGF